MATKWRKTALPGRENNVRQDGPKAWSPKSLVTERLFGEKVARNQVAGTADYLGQIDGRLRRPSRS